MTRRSHDHNCFLCSFSACEDNICCLLIKSQVASISVWTELRAGPRLARSAVAAVWLMAERVQDALWLLQIGTAETWQQKCSELHTHISFFSPLNTKPQAEHPTMGGLLPTCPSHLVGAATCQMSFPSARNVAASIQRLLELNFSCHVGSVYIDLAKECNRLNLAGISEVLLSSNSSVFTTTWVVGNSSLISEVTPQLRSV